MCLSTLISSYESNNPTQKHKDLWRPHSHAPYAIQAYVLQTYVAKAKPEHLADSLKARLPQKASVFLLV